MQIKCSTKAQKQLSTDRSPLELNVKHEYIPDLKKLLFIILGRCPFWLILILFILVTIRTMSNLSDKSRKIHMESTENTLQNRI
jgi:hypothetical protein